jgi:hypothetical protein
MEKFSDLIEEMYKWTYFCKLLLKDCHSELFTL